MSDIYAKKFQLVPVNAVPKIYEIYEEYGPVDVMAFIHYTVCPCT
jgi:hypothetical protein